VHLHRLDEARQLDLLEARVNEGAHALGQRGAVWARGQRLPINAYRHILYFSTLYSPILSDLKTGGYF
jgi:hypothetical protein